MNTQARFQVRRGTKSTLPDTILPYEITYNTDEKELYIGEATGIPSRFTRNKEINYILENGVFKNSEEINLYVSNRGNDNNDGSEEKPYKTIQKAIDSLPLNLKYNVTINIEGGVYNEDIKIQGFSNIGGFIRLVGDTETSTNVTVNSITVRYTTYIKILGINVLQKCNVDNCNYVYFKNINMTNRNEQIDGIIIFASKSYIVDSNISYRSHAIVSQYLSSVVTNNNIGTGNTYSLTSTYGSLIAKVGVQPDASTAERITTGGIIR